MHNRWTCKDNFWFRPSKFVLLYSPPPQRQLICVTGKTFLITVPSDLGNRTHAFYERLIVSFGYFVLLSILIKTLRFPPSSFEPRFCRSISWIRSSRSSAENLSWQVSLLKTNCVNCVCDKSSLVCLFLLWAGPLITIIFWACGYLLSWKKTKRKWIPRAFFLA